MKTVTKQVLRTIVCLLALTLINCQQEDDIQKIDTKQQSQKVTSKIITGNDIPFIIDFIKSKSNDNLEFIIKDNSSPDAMMRDDTDNLILTTVLTDYVNQVTNDDDVSNYTFDMEEISDQDGYFFLNLVVKEYNDSYYISIIKYVPDPLWLASNTKSQDFSSYTGSMYFYDEQGIYLANMTFNDGDSTDFGYDPPCPDSDSANYLGDWIGDNYPSGDGAGLGDLPCDTSWYSCNGPNADIFTTRVLTVVL